MLLKILIVYLYFLVIDFLSYFVQSNFKLRMLLNKLPDSFREAFEMSRNQMLTHKEIAVILNVSPQTVNYRLCKALDILRVELKDYLPLLLLLFSSQNI